MGQRHGGAGRQRIGPYLVKEEAPDEEYWVPYKDNHGHSSKLTVSIHPGHEAALQKLATHPDSPFQSVDDVVRYAVHHTLLLLDTRGEGWMPSVLSMVKAQVAVLRDEQYRIDFERIFEETGYLVDKHNGEGQIEMTWDLLNNIWKQIQLMPDGDWRTKYEGRFLGLYGDMGFGQAG